MTVISQENTGRISSCILLTDTHTSYPCQTMSVQTYVLNFWHFWITNPSSPQCSAKTILIHGMMAKLQRVRESTVLQYSSAGKWHIHLMVLVGIQNLMSCKFLLKAVMVRSLLHWSSHVQILSIWSGVQQSPQVEAVCVHTDVSVGRPRPVQWTPQLTVGRTCTIGKAQATKPKQQYPCSPAAEYITNNKAE